MPLSSTTLRCGALLLACLSFGTAEAAEAHSTTLTKRMHKQPMAIQPVTEWLDQPLQLIKTDSESQSGSSLRGTKDILAAQQAEEERLARQFDLVNHTAIAAQRATEDKLANEAAAAVQKVDQQATEEEADAEAPVQKEAPVQQEAPVQKPAPAKALTQFSAQVVSVVQDLAPPTKDVDSVLPKPLQLTAKAVGADVKGNLPKGLSAQALEVTQQGQLVVVRYQLGSKTSTVAVEQRFVLKFEPQGPLAVTYVPASGEFAMSVPGPKPMDTSLQHIAVKMKGSPPAAAKLLSTRGLDDYQQDDTMVAISQSSEDDSADSAAPPPPPPAAYEQPPPPPPASQDWVAIPVQTNSF